MPVVPLGAGAYRYDSGLVPEVRCLNMYLVADKSGISPDNTLRVQRPGLSEDAMLPGIIRGVHYDLLNNRRFSVAGGHLYVDGADVGVVDADVRVSMVSTAFATAIATSGSAYLYTEALALISMPDGRQVIDVDQLDGYIILLCPDGRFYWLEPGQTTVDPLNFATAESSADAAIAVCRVGDEFWIFGADSIEPWQSSGDQDAPFAPAVGRVYSRGCLERDSVRRFDNSVVWVGEDFNVYRGGSVPEILSDPAISERVRNRTAGISAFTVSADAEKFYVLRIPGQGTFALAASNRTWSEWGTDGNDTWRPHVGYEANGRNIVGSSDSGEIWEVTPSAINDDGVAFTRLVTATVPIMGRPPRNDSFSVGLGCSDDCTVRVRWRDGQDEYPEYYEELDARASFDVCTLYRLGQPDQPYREIEVSVVDDVRVRFAGAMANEGWQ
jgi:hypothetical protein